MMCARPLCDAAEDRQDGYCSVYCQDVHEVQLERDEALAERDNWMEEARQRATNADDAKAEAARLRGECLGRVGSFQPVLVVLQHGLITTGKARECLERWLKGEDFRDPANREWESVDLGPSTWDQIESLEAENQHLRAELYEHAVEFLGSSYVNHDAICRLCAQTTPAEDGVMAAAAKAAIDHTEDCPLHGYEPEEEK